MMVQVLDPQVCSDLIAQRKALGQDGFDEVWEGVYVMAPLANNEHQNLGTRLGTVFYQFLTWPDAMVYVGVNVSDREEDWRFNFRIPDVAVYLAGNSGRDCGTHWFGGPDWAAEILSEGDRSREKFDFYAKVNVRELLLVDRDPWELELWQNQAGQFVSLGKSSLADGEELTSTVLPVTFRLLPAEPRPRIEVVHQRDGRRWLV